MKSLSKICLRPTNFETIIFHIIFLTIPYFCFINENTQILQYYWAYLLGISKTFTILDNSKFFKNLYPNKPKNLVGYLSKTIINIVIIFGILAHCIDMRTDNLNKIIVTGLFLFISTYLLSNYWVEYIINFADKYQKNNIYNLYRFIFGLLAILSIIVFQFIINFIINKIFL